MRSKNWVRKNGFNYRRKKIIPVQDYYICSGSTPKDKKVEFVAVDEIQMCSDRERGHIFTEDF